MTQASGNDPPRASSVRPLAKILSAAVPIWVTSHDGRIAYVSASCGQWLGVQPESLVGRAAHNTAATAPADVLDDVVAALVPPAECLGHEAMMRRVYPPRRPTVRDAPPTARDVLFVPIPGEGTVSVLAIADVLLPVDQVEKAEFRRLLDVVHRQLAAFPRHLPAAVTLGTSIWALRLNRQIALASSTLAHVTLSGPPGSGFEAVARLIHAGASAEGDGVAPHLNSPPFVVVAGALMDAELFDATTSSVVSRMMDEERLSVTLLVHDIDQMPVDAQERLELLAGNYQRRLRLILTTTHSPTSLIPTLIPSLAVVVGATEILLAPLHQRMDDVPIIAAALLQRRRSSGETRAARIGREALDRLVLYPWPGNYDELDAAIRHAARQCRGETIHVDHLPLAIRSYGQSAPRPVVAKGARAVRVGSLEDALAAAERRCIVAALEQSRGNRSAAARLLEISRPRLLRRIEQLGIAWPPS